MIEHHDDLALGQVIRPQPLQQSSDALGLVRDGLLTQGTGPLAHINQHLLDDRFQVPRPATLGGLVAATLVDEVLKDLVVCEDGRLRLDDSHGSVWDVVVVRVQRRPEGFWGFVGGVVGNRLVFGATVSILYGEH